MPQYNVTYQVGDLVATRTLSLLDATSEQAIKELKRRGLVNDAAEVQILEITERFGVC